MSRNAGANSTPPITKTNLKFMRFLIPPGKRVLELGCGTGDLLAALEPSYGVASISAPRLGLGETASSRSRFCARDVEDPATLAAIEGPFDYIVIADTIGMFEDIDGTLALVHHLCAPSTRIIISYYSHLWEPVQNSPRRWLAAQAAQDQLHRHHRLPQSDGSCGFRGDRRRAAAIAAAALAGPGPFHQSFHRAIARDQKAVPAHLSGGVRSGSFRIANSRSASSFPAATSAHIESAIRRMPKFAAGQEILFVEGNSSDGTFEECERIRDAYRDQWDIKVLKQDGKGKAMPSAGALLRDRRCPDDSRCRFDDAAEACRQLSCRSRIDRYQSAAAPGGIVKSASRIIRTSPVAAAKPLRTASPLPFRPASRP